MTSRASATSATSEAGAASSTKGGRVITAPKSASKTAQGAWVSRAVIRAVQPGSWVECRHCGEQVKYQVRAHHMQMICNVYRDGKWLRVEHFHADCYGESGSPYGPPVED